MVALGAGGLLGGRLVGKALARYPLAQVLRLVLALVATALVIVVLATAKVGPTELRLVVLVPTMMLLGAA